MQEKDKKQFIKTHFDLLKDSDFLAKNKCKYVLYLLIRRSVVREEFVSDLGLYKNFWKKGYLASSKPVSYFSKMFGYKSSSSIRKWINELVEEKVIVIKGVYTKPGRPQHVFILGVHNSMSGKNYSEHYYVDRPELIDEFGVEGMVDFYKLSKSSTLNC